MNKKIRLGTAALFLSVLAVSADAALVSDKVTLNDNMTLKYSKIPKRVDTLGRMFTEGMFYGRLRLNTFYWDWKNEYPNKTKDNKAMGIGGSFIYKSAKLSGFSTTFGLYTSQNPDFFRMDKEDVMYVKAGKDTFSRYKVVTQGHFGMTVLGQAYLQYDLAKTSIKGGRQLFESVFTKSNDTKMIPNTFDGMTLISRDLPKTTIKLAYLTAQKLRDHTHAHDVIANDGTWNGNDDSGANKNLTPSLIGSDNKLIIASMTNKSLKNFKANISAAAVPGVLDDIVLEVHYSVPVGTWKLVPGVRYYKQMDDLGAGTGVANLKGNQTGYTSPNSLDGALLCARLDIKNGGFLGRLGYSKVDDKADIVNPWRGFPTAGYTRVMGQYNWYANTTTYLVRAGYDFDKRKIIPGFSIMGRIAFQDFDENKPGVQADSNVLNIDARENITKDMQLKFRLAIADAKEKNNKDYSYSEYRFEVNYFF